MSKIFKHPLARAATLAKFRGRDGAEHEGLVIVTTLELDPAAKGYSAKNVERLQAAAQEFLAEHEGIAAFTLVSRPKTW